MLWQYQLTNFKAFGETDPLPIRPITLIYGPNSSGKSSILQSLLLLKQTLEEAESDDTLLLPQGKLTNLGNYREFVHCHDISQPFAFKVLFQLGDAPDLGLRIAFGYDQQTSTPLFSDLDVFQGDETLPLVTYQAEEIREQVVLTVSKVYSEHPFWQNWWKHVQPKLFEVFFQQVNSTVQIYQRLKKIPSNTNLM